MKKLMSFLVFVVGSISAFAQTGAITGYCVQGATQASTSGNPSTNYLQGVVPTCTVTVYLTGTTTLATIYSNSSSTPLSNPFTAPFSGQWLFYASNGQGYDVVLSGGSYPNTYTTPVTLTGLYAFNSGGGTINPSPQYEIPFFSSSGTGNFLTGSTTILTDAGGDLIDTNLASTNTGVVINYASTTFGSNYSGPTITVSAPNCSVAPTINYLLGTPGLNAVYPVIPPGGQGTCTPNSAPPTVTITDSTGTGANIVLALQPNAATAGPTGAFGITPMGGSGSLVTQYGSILQAPQLETPILLMTPSTSGAYSYLKCSGTIGIQPWLLGDQSGIGELDIDNTCGNQIGFYTQGGNAAFPGKSVIFGAQPQNGSTNFGGVQVNLVSQAIAGQNAISLNPSASSIFSIPEPTGINFYLANTGGVLGLGVLGKGSGYTGTGSCTLTGGTIVSGAGDTCTVSLGASGNIIPVLVGTTTYSVPPTMTITGYSGGINALLSGLTVIQNPNSISGSLWQDTIGTLHYSNSYVGCTGCDAMNFTIGGAAVFNGRVTAGALTVSNITSSGFQCLHAGATGVVSGTGTDCGSGSGSSSVTVNGGSNLTTANFNATTPAAGTGYLNVTWQNSTTNVSAEVPYATGAALGVSEAGTGLTATSGVFSVNAINLATSGSGGVTGLLPHANIASTAVTPGSYTNTNITVAADGSITAASNGSGGGSSALSAITAATGANTIASGNNGAQVWNWAQTTNSQTAFTFGETTAATGTSDLELAVKTLAGSTAVPLTVTDSLTGSQTIAAFQILPTWNTTGVVDAALLINVTNTASGTASKLIDAQIAGTSEFSVDKAGNILATGSISSGSTPPTCTGLSIICATEQGTANTSASGVDSIQAISTTHQWEVSLNGGTPFISLMNYNGGSPPALGGTTPAAGTFTNLGATVALLAGPAAAAITLSPTSTVANFANTSGSSSRVAVTSFGGSSYHSVVAFGGTSGSPTAVTATTEIGGFNAFAYNGTSLNGPIGAFRVYANQTQTTSAGGTYADITTTPNGSLTQAEVMRFNSDAGVTVPSTVTGGDEGAGTINAGGLYVNGVAVTTAATGLAFTNITSGTNTSAAMVVSGSASLAPASVSSGTITASNGYIGGTVQSFGTAAALTAVVATAANQIPLSSGAGTNVWSAVNYVPASSGGTGINSNSSTGVAQVSSGTWSVAALPLTSLATQANDTVVMNATGSSAAPTAVALPTSGTNGCAGSTQAINYNTTTHTYGCTTIGSPSVPGWLLYYGDGSDGALSYSTNTTLNTGTYFATTWACSGTTTLSGSNAQALIIRATTSITIGGSCTISSSNTNISIGGDWGGSGGGGGGGTAGGTAGNANKLPAGATFITVAAAGAAGGSSNGTGGPGNTPSTQFQRSMIDGGTSYPETKIYCGASGGGGGSGGGAGANGGGCIILVAPIITIASGATFNASGGVGTSVATANEGGGGGGGGGVVIIRSPGLTDSGATFNIAGGAGGTGGSGGTGGTGGAGWYKEIFQ